MRNLLTDVAGITVGHATDLALGSGVTAIMFERPAIASASMLGGVPGERQVAMLDEGMTLDSVDAIVLLATTSGMDISGSVILPIQLSYRFSIFTASASLLLAPLLSTAIWGCSHSCS